MDQKSVHILLVEDDENLGFMLQDFLQMEGYQVTLRKDGASGLKTFKELEANICILDVMLPHQDGFSVAAEIRKLDQDVPFIFLTAKSQEEDRIRGLKLGADDYITKPFSTEELKLRLEIILKRRPHTGPTTKQEKYAIGLYEFDFANQVLSLDGEERRLTKKEALLLRLLCKNINTLVRREIALTNIWGADDYFMGRSMDVYIAKLRRYLGDDPAVTITNVHGTGFKLEVGSGE